MIGRSGNKGLYPHMTLLVVLIIASLSGTHPFGVNLHFAVGVSAQSSGDYLGPEVCRTCHSQQYTEWNGTAHSQAFEDPVFQDAWDDMGRPDDCLQCHTTGYDPSTGTYAFEGVTCENCHGPGMTMKVSTTVELCGSCHTGEYGHNKFEEFTKGTHYGSGVTCIDCHMYEETHTFEIESKACATCHTDGNIHSRSTIPDLQSRVFEAEEKFSQLEEEYIALQNEIEEMGQRSTLVAQITVGGGAAIVILSAVVVVAYLRHRKGE